MRAFDDERLRELGRRRRRERALEKTGPRNPRWKGGASKYPGHAELKRARLRVLAKHPFCYFCELPSRMTHHKNLDRKDHRDSNLAALCVRCHRKLHYLLRYLDKTSL